MVYFCVCVDVCVKVAPPPVPIPTQLAQTFRRLLMSFRQIHKAIKLLKRTTLVGLMRMSNRAHKKKIPSNSYAFICDNFIGPSARAGLSTLFQIYISWRLPLHCLCPHRVQCSVTHTVSIFNNWRGVEFHDDLHSMFRCKLTPIPKVILRIRTMNQMDVMQIGFFFVSQDFSSSSSSCVACDFGRCVVVADGWASFAHTPHTLCESNRSQYLKLSEVIGNWKCKNSFFLSICD